LKVLIQNDILKILIFQKMESNYITMKKKFGVIGPKKLIVVIVPSVMLTTKTVTEIMSLQKNQWILQILQ
jgi:hypothetical protein